MKKRTNQDKRGQASIFDALTYFTILILASSIIYTIPGNTEDQVKEDLYWQMKKDTERTLEAITTSTLPEWNDKEDIPISTAIQILPLLPTTPNKTIQDQKTTLQDHPLYHQLKEELTKTTERLIPHIYNYNLTITNPSYTLEIGYPPPTQKDKAAKTQQYTYTNTTFRLQLWYQ